VPEDNRDHAENQQRAEAILGALHLAQAVGDHDEVEKQQHGAADKAPFLGKNREDEIGVLRRQKVEAVLRAVEKALAEEPPRADGDLRLNHVIAGAERIAIGIEKSEDAVALIGFEKMPRDRQERETRADQKSERSKAQPAHQNHAD